jgi:septal ring factor EnvC (AmiA/AmiB activator)
MGCTTWDMEDVKKEVNLKPELDKVTRLLCSVCKANPPHPDSELGQWYTAHSAQDKQRLQAETAEAVKEIARLEKQIKGLGKGIDHASRAMEEAMEKLNVFKTKHKDLLNEVNALNQD